MTEDKDRSLSDARRWNERYRAELAAWQSREPRQLLVDHLHLLPTAGLALDAACGVGHNSLLVARHGLRVIALDISTIALRAAARAARQEGLLVFPAVYDLSLAWFPPDTFDLIMNFHFLERATFPAYRSALKPGGWLFFETFVRTGLPMADATFYLEPEELRAFYEDYEVLFYEETRLSPTELRPGRGMARLIARRPL